ncbi:MAG: protein kinase [Myxococcales bacterium]|nr:protein kinase [Myxococcales bacterium]
MRPNDALAVRFERELALTSRLQHPAIVSIHDAGTWTNGEPFYVMRLVTGESLDRVIARHATFTERLALLPHAIAAVDAIAYAHARRVIHRDLKPANILVGEFGETVVIDWGLAKELRDEAEPPTLGDGLASAGETELGAVLGTPAFMAPEQAHGEAVDERADVYALGAVLYATFSGVAPYVGSSTAAILASVVSEAPTPIRELVPAVPPDLATIIETAMARDPGQRYATAGELAAELKRFQHGQLVAAHRYTRAERLWRWIRKHRTAAIVGVAALVLVGIVGGVSLRRVFVEQARAERARDEALNNRASAEEVMRYILGQMQDRLGELGKLELLEAPARKVLAYYVGTGAKTPEDLYQQTRARLNLADVLVTRGDRLNAWVEASTANALRQFLLSLDPGDPTRLHAAAASQDRLGDLLAERGDPTGARRAYETSLALVEHLATDPESKRDVFVSLLLIGGTSADAGDLTRAVTDLTRAKQIAVELAAAAPKDRDARRDLMVAHQRLGIVLKARGALPAALEDFRAALVLSAALLAETPDAVETIRDHALNHDMLAQALLAQADPRGAMVEIRASRALAARLIEREPANLPFQRSLLTVDLRLVEAMLASDDLAGAQVETVAALELAARLAAADPTSADDQRSLEVVTNKLGLQLLAAGKPAQALERFRAAFAIATELVARDPRPLLRQDLALAHRHLAEAYGPLGETAAAETSLRAAIAILDEGSSRPSRRCSLHRHRPRACPPAARRAGRGA